MSELNKVDTGQLLEAYRHTEGGLLPCLHEIQKHEGHVPAHLIPAIASAFNLSRAEVWGTLSFYSFFRTEPQTKYAIQVCQAESCQSMGAFRLMSDLSSALDADPNLRGRVATEAVYCFGNCACSPCARIDSDVLGDVSVEMLLSVARSHVDGVKHD